MCVFLWCCCQRRQCGRQQQQNRTARQACQQSVQLCRSLSSSSTKKTVTHITNNCVSVGFEKRCIFSHFHSSVAAIYCKSERQHRAAVTGPGTTPHTPLISETNESATQRPQTKFILWVLLLNSIEFMQSSAIKYKLLIIAISWSGGGSSSNSTVVVPLPLCSLSSGNPGPLEAPLGMSQLHQLETYDWYLISLIHLQTFRVQFMFLLVGLGVWLL